MPKFRKKPVEIEAIQLPEGVLEGETSAEGARKMVEFEQQMRAFAPDDYQTWRWSLARSESRSGLTIPTLEGDHLASPGDWIIKGVKGEFYPCKPDIFEATYESVMSKSDEDYLAEIDAEAVRRGYMPDGESLVAATGPEPWLEAWRDDPTLSAQEQVANEIAYAVACADA